MVKHVRDQVGAISKAEHSQVVRERTRVRQKAQDVIVPRDQRNEFGGMVVLASKRTRAALLAADEFGAHTAYVIGETEVDSEQQRITITYSTENLLLNAYRQSQYGFPQIVQVDCTSRLDGQAVQVYRVRELKSGRGEGEVGQKREASVRKGNNGGKLARKWQS